MKEGGSGRGRVAQEALESSGVGAWCWTFGGAIEWDAQTSELFGVSEPPTDFEEYASLIHPDDREVMETAFAGAVERASAGSEPGSYSFEHRVLRGDAECWLECRGRVEVDADGKPVRVLGTSANITKRKQTEAALRQREEELRMLADLASDYVYIVDVSQATYLPRVVAGSFEHTTGYTMELLAERGGWLNVVHPDDRESSGTVLRQVVAGIPGVTEYRICDPHGEVLWLRDRIRPVEDPATGEVVAIRGAVQNVTTEKKLEEQLADARKDEALARFSGNAAHDFNNLLTVILGSADLLGREELSDFGEQMLNTIRNAADQASELTRGMLLFGRRMSGEPRTLEIEEIIAQVEPMLKQGLGQQHRLEVVVEPGAGRVRIDGGQLQLLLLNLVVNARQAMESGGSVRLTVRNEEVALDDERRPPDIAEGRYLLMTIEDEGCGVPQHALPHIFDPFFTTRPPGEGAGMGLAACHGIARKAGGTITVTNTEKGARFTVFLPESGSAVDSPAPRQGNRLEVGGNERLLVVDDDQTLRRLFSHVLAELGYAVTTCGSGEEAAKLLAEQAFDLVVSDIIMPGMGGIALADMISQRWPETTVLLISGNIDGYDAGYPFLAKPLTPTGLSRRIREMLDQAS